MSSSSFGNTGGSYDLQLSSIRSGAVTNDIRAGDRKSKVHENGSEEQIFGINRSVDVRVDVESLSQCSVGKTTPKTSFDMGPRESKTAIPITRASGS